MIPLNLCCFDIEYTKKIAFGKQAQNPSEKCFGEIRALFSSCGLAGSDWQIFVMNPVQHIKQDVQNFCLIVPRRQGKINIAISSACPTDMMHLQIHVGQLTAAIEPEEQM